MNSEALDRLRIAMADQSLDAVIITSAINRSYYSGFFAGDHGPSMPDSAVIADRNGTDVFLAGANELDWASAETNAGDIRKWSHPWQDSVAAVIKERGYSRIGAEDNALSVSAWNLLVEAIGENVELVGLGAQLSDSRFVKSPDELAKLRHALDLTDRALAAVEEHIQPGKTEYELAQAVRIAMLENGAEDVAFPTIVASGVHASRPHHRPGTKQINEGEPIIFDLGARFEGYNGDLTRTFILGESDAKFDEIYAIVLEAQLAALAAIAPGMTGKEVDAIARDIISAAGYGDYFVHSLGHGLGIEVHEGPRLSSRSEDVLAPGHVVTVEPGIYLPDWGGVRIEDVIVVTETGNENLTRSPK